MLKDKNISLILRGATGFVKNAKSTGPTSLFTFFYRFNFLRSLTFANINNRDIS